MAQGAETTVTECSPTSCSWARFRIGSMTMPGQRHGQPCSDFVGPRVYACLGVTCLQYFWQNDRGLLRATAVTRGGGTDIKLDSAHKVNSGGKKANSREEISPAAPAGIRTRNFSITSPALLPTSYPGWSYCISWLIDGQRQVKREDEIRADSWGKKKDCCQRLRKIVLEVSVYNDSDFIWLLLVIWWTVFSSWSV